MTDYEAKFYAEGKNINRCVATMEPWEEPEEEERPKRRTKRVNKRKAFSLPFASSR